MNFLLRNLENQVCEAAFLEGELLLEAGAVGALREIERNLWIAPVKNEAGTGEFEVEVNTTPSRVRAATCDCPVFQETGECPHVVAVVLAIRRELTDRQKKKSPAAPQPMEPPARLTTAAVLNRVNHEDLVGFIKEYARRHRSFALALKARFANQVAGIDSREKYVQLLDSTLNLARRPDRSINLRGAQKIMRVLDELSAQREEAIVRKHYLEALSIIQSILDRLPPVLGKLPPSAKQVETEIRQNFGALRRLTGADLPPPLREAIRNYALGELPKLAYRQYGLDLLFLQFLADSAQEPAQTDELVAALTAQMEKYRSENRPIAPLLLLQWQTLERAGRESESQQLVEGNLLNPDILLAAVEQALLKGQPARARRLALAGLEAGTDDNTTRKLQDYLMRIADEQGDTATLADLVETRLLTCLDKTAFYRLKELLRDTWGNYRHTLFARFQQLPPSPSRLDLLAFMLAEEKQDRSLLALLQDARSIDLLLHYDRYLIPGHQEELFRLYQELIIDYAQHHLGPKSSRKIRKILDHLQDIGLAALAGRLVREFRDNYPERHTLIEQLAEL